MAKDPRTTPTGVKAPHGASVMHITWAGALFLALVAIVPFIARTVTSVQALQLSSSGMLIVVGVVLDTMKQMEAQRVGNYALSFTWGDQHATGIYSFTYLRSLCQCDECKPTFAVGTERDGADDGKT